MPTTQVTAGRAGGYDPLASVSIMEQLRTATSDIADAAQDSADRPPADRPAVPGARRGDGRRSSCSPRFMVFLDGRQASQAAGLVGDRDRNADALAAPRARHRARRAGADRGVRRGDRQPRPLQGRPRRAAVGRRRQGRQPRRRAGRATVVKLLQEIRRALGPRRRQRPARDRQPAEPGLAGQGAGEHQPRQQRAARPRAAGGAADRPGRRHAARDRVREPAGRAVAAHRQERQRARLERRDRSRGRVPARQGREHVPRDPQRAPQGQRRAAPRAVRSEDARATLAELSKRFAAYDAGVGAILQNMARLVAAKQAARGVNNESEALLGETTRLAARVRGRRGRAATRCGRRSCSPLLGARRAAAPRQGVPRRRPRSRLRERAREQAQPGGDPAPVERDGQPRRRRPHGAGVGDRGRDRRDRRLDQLHDRGAAHAGEGHQLGDRPGDEGDAGCAGDLEPPVRGVAAAEPGDPAGVGVGAADGAVDRRSVAVGGAIGARGAAVAGRRREGRASRCRTRSPA